MNDKQIKAECCDFGREYLQWGGAQWWVLFNLQRGGGSWPATHCICGSKLTPPPDIEKEICDLIDLFCDIIDRRLAARSRIKETE
jgi:hypothetical protein